jgi:enoyl-[acyl-carrier protein] reductase II
VKKTRIGDLFHIEHPIVQGGMLWLANAQLAAAVSNAGALGTVSPLAGMERHGDAQENLRLQIRETRRLTERPFAVNIPLDLPYSGVLIDVTLQEDVEIVVTSAGSPSLYTELLHHRGITVIHVVSSVKQAQLAESCRVNAVIVEGVEAGGHIGFDELPLFSLLPQVVDSITLPVIAAGGIVDARAVVAAFSFGAEGVQLGTRFVAVEECIAHPSYKGAIVKAQDTGTVITCRKLLPARSLKTAFSHKLLELEDSGASAQDISDFLGYSRARKAQLEGDLIEGEAYCGASVGLIKEVMTVSSVIQQLVEGYEHVVKTFSDPQ